MVNYYGVVILRGFQNNHKVAVLPHKYIRHLWVAKDAMCHFCVEKCVELTVFYSSVKTYITHTK